MIEKRDAIYTCDFCGKKEVSNEKPAEWESLCIARVIESAYEEEDEFLLRENDDPTLDLCYECYKASPMKIVKKDKAELSP